MEEEFEWVEPEGYSMDSAQEEEVEWVYPDGSAYTDTREKNTITDDIAALGQIAAEGVSLGLLGDEAIGVGRAAVDYLMDPDGQSFSDRVDMYTKDARKQERTFRDTNPGTALGVDLATSIMPAVKIAGAVGNAATRVGNIGRQAAAGAGEGAVRGFMDGEDDWTDRYAKAVTYGAIGGVLGGAGGSLMRGSKEIAGDLTKAGNLRKKDRPVAATESENSLAGKEGFVSKNQAYKQEGKLNKTFSFVADSMSERAAKVISPRFGQLLTRADGDRMKLTSSITDDVNKVGVGLRKLDKWFHSKDPKAKHAWALTLNANAKNGPDGKPISEAQRELMLRKAEGLMPEGYVDTYRKMREVIDALSKDDPITESTIGYYPRRTSGTFLKRKNDKKRLENAGIGNSMRRLKGFMKSSSNVDSDRPWISKIGELDNYRAPTSAFLDYVEEAAAVQSTIKNFGLEDIVYPGSKASTKPNTKKAIEAGGPARVPLDSAAKAIAKGVKRKMGKDGAKAWHKKEAVSMMEDFVESSRVGPNAALQSLRTATSVALLGTPENAVLQLGDAGAGAYLSGLTGAMRTLPKAVWSMITTDTDKVVQKGIYDDFIRAPDLGVTRQFLGELKKEGDTTVSKALDFWGDKIMSMAGVRKVNRLGQEVTINLAWNRAKALAKGNPNKLAEELVGWQPQEIKALINDLKSGDRSDLVDSYVFSQLTRLQPVSTSALPQAYSRHPNGRVLYAMKTYMIKQAALIRNDIAGKMAEAYKVGLNTPEGKKLAGEAMRNSARYVALVAVINGYVDEKRRVPRTGEDNYEPVRSTARQLVGNVSGGIIDIDSAKYGKDATTGMIPPALQAPGAALTGAVDFVQDPGDEAAIKFYKSVNKFMPGIRQAQWFKDTFGDAD